jgi:hypothetical protein
MVGMEICHLAQALMGFFNVCSTLKYVKCCQSVLFESWSSTSISVDYIPYFFLKNIADYMFISTVSWKVYPHSFSRKSFYRPFARPCLIKSKRPAPPVWKVKYSEIFKNFKHHVTSLYQGYGCPSPPSSYICPFLSRGSGAVSFHACVSVSGSGSDTFNILILCHWIVDIWKRYKFC